MSVMGLCGIAQAQSPIDVISLAKFTDTTPGGSKWFNGMSFGSTATYSGSIKVAKDESGLVFGKKSDAFYVETPVEDARLKMISINYLTPGDIVVYVSKDRKLSMSGGSDVMKFTISQSDNVLTLTDDYKYLIFRNPGDEVIVSSVTVMWEFTGLLANVDVPALLVDGVEHDASTEIDLEGGSKTISFSHSAENATIYYLWEPENHAGLPLYTPFTEEFAIDENGTLSYNCEVNGQESDVLEVKVIGAKEPEMDSIDEIGAEASAAEVEWIDLQGRKVNKPGKGVYIIRSTNGTVKKIIK